MKKAFKRMLYLSMLARTAVILPHLISMLWAEHMQLSNSVYSASWSHCVPAPAPPKKKNNINVL